MAYGWPPEAKFLVPDEVATTSAATSRPRPGAARSLDGEVRRVQKAVHGGGRQLDLILAGRLPKDWDADVAAFPADAKGMATRVSREKSSTNWASEFRGSWAGSADLAPSTLTLLPSMTPAATSSPETTPAAISTSASASTSWARSATAWPCPACGLTARPSSSSATTCALDPPGRIDGPAGPVHLHARFDRRWRGWADAPADRAPGGVAGDSQSAVVLRPGDANETAEAYKAALLLGGQPAALVLTRQNLPTLDRTKFAPAAGVQKGGYVLADAADGRPQVILIGTGSEVRSAWPPMKSSPPKGSRPG